MIRNIYSKIPYFPFHNNNISKFIGSILHLVSVSICFPVENNLSPCYVDLTYIPHPSNNVERLISIGKLILRDNRTRLNPLSFEILKISKPIWKISTLNRLVNSK